REPALLPSGGVVDLESDPNRARALLRRSRRRGEWRCAGLRSRAGGLGINAARTFQGRALGKRRFALAPNPAPGRSSGGAQACRIGRGLVPGGRAAGGGGGGCGERGASAKPAGGVPRYRV